MQRLVAIVDEPSKDIFLRNLQRRLDWLNRVPTEYQIANGYPEILRLVDAVTRWRDPNMRFLILCDQDSANCHERKRRLSERVIGRHRGQTLIRIVCPELESWYIGDPGAVQRLFPHVRVDRHPAIFRPPPDQLAEPAKWLMRQTGERKRGLAEMFGNTISTTQNRSHSFQTFLQGLQQLLNPT